MLGGGGGGRVCVYVHACVRVSARVCFWVVVFNFHLDYFYYLFLLTGYIWNSDAMSEPAVVVH